VVIAKTSLPALEGAEGIVSEPQQLRRPKILLLATSACAYPGADYVGQTHSEYPANIYIIRVPAPAVFPPEFYLRCFEKGIDAIVAMSCGQECPYPGAYQRFAERVGRTHALMKQRGLDPRRLRTTAICTVCARAFLKEVQDMVRLVTDTTDHSEVRRA
jgi:F420-non-reducing hydrogenase iron-sulfur subunit